MNVTNFYISSFDQMASGVASASKTFAFNYGKSAGLASGAGVLYYMLNMEGSGAEAAVNFLCSGNAGTITRFWVYVSANASGTDETATLRAALADGIVVTIPAGTTGYFSNTGLKAISASDGLNVALSAGAGITYKAWGFIVEAS